MIQTLGPLTFILSPVVGGEGAEVEVKVTRVNPLPRSRGRGETFILSP